MANEYEKQARGDDTAYERYLAGMDLSMRQKIALTAAHLLGEGTVADMGMGSGSGSAALAGLYPRLKVVGVDVNPEMVRRAAERYSLSNLSFVTGNVAERVFAPGSLTGIFDSSVLHHVTSFSGYDHAAAGRALEQQVTQLAFGATLIVRDFVAPATERVLFDVPADDGDDSDHPRTASSARLLERFAREFRPLSATPGFYLKPLSAASDVRSGWRRYELDHRMAVEFLLRKDYREDYDSELLEEYTYYTQAEFEGVFSKLGLRLLASMPVYNPWIVKHRFENRAELRALDGHPLELPPTNYLIVGERVPLDEGVRFEQQEPRAAVGFLELVAFERIDDQSRRELVRRPGTTLDIVPWFRDMGALFVIVRRSHPRPVLEAPTDAVLDDSTSVGYVTEPILAVMSDAPLGMTVERTLREAAQIDADHIRSMREAGHYYPSPGGIVEEVRAVHVEVTPRFVITKLENASGFSTAGVVQAVDARQLLRAAQVGALPDARLELNVYELLVGMGEPLGPWIGAELDPIPDSDGPTARFADVSLAARRCYRATEAGTHAAFLELKCHDFAEMNAAGETLFVAPREYVVPKTLSTNTLACALLRRHRDEILLGIDEDDLAAAQAFTGTSALLVAPAWRIPKPVTSLGAAIAWVSVRLKETYGLSVATTTELGGRYRPSAGLTPEVVYPVAMAVTADAACPSRLHWVPLLEVVRELHRIQDGHLRIVALRAAHAAGLLR